MLQVHLPRVIYHQAYHYTKKRCTRARAREKRQVTNPSERETTGYEPESERETTGYEPESSTTFTTPCPSWGISKVKFQQICQLLARAEDAQGTPTQSHISPSILVYEEESTLWVNIRQLWSSKFGHFQNCGHFGRTSSSLLLSSLELSDTKVYEP